MTLLRPSQAPFHGIVPGAVVPPVSLITLPVTFGTQENFCTETLQFEVADFETAHNAFLGWPTLSMFMVIPYYAYLVLKMPGPRGGISIRETSSGLLIVIGRVARQLTDSWHPQSSKN
jgi:hypothetical protein